MVVVGGELREEDRTGGRKRKVGECYTGKGREGLEGERRGKVRVRNSRVERAVGEGCGMVDFCWARYE